MSDFFVILITIAGFSNHIFCFEAIEELSMSKDSNLSDKLFNQSALRNVSMASLVRCTRLCLDTSNCKSLFYDRKSRRCQLHSAPTYKITDCVDEIGWKFYTKYPGKYAISVLLLLLVYDFQLSSTQYIQSNTITKKV